MRKIEITENILNQSRYIYSKKNSIYELPNGDILKLLSLDYMSSYQKYMDANLADKILFSKVIPDVLEIVVPKDAICFNHKFVGYTMPKVEGKSYFQFCNDMPFEYMLDLLELSKLYLAIEDPVERAKDVVFPDLYTPGNVLISKNMGHYQVYFVDYDGLQVNGYSSFEISSGLGDVSRFFNSKYLTSDGDFTKELDKWSLFHLYFLIMFNIDLNCIGQFYPRQNRVITLNDVFGFLHLDDMDIRAKVYHAFCQDTPSEYLGKGLYRFAEQYTLGATNSPFEDNRYCKVLVKK